MTQDFKGVRKRFRWPLAFALAVAAASGGRFSPVSAQAPGSDISPEALAQIDALVLEKDTRTAQELKIDSQLLYELRMERGVPVAQGVTVVETDLPYASDGHLILDVKATDTALVSSNLAALGIETISSTQDGAMLRVHVNIDQVEQLASLPDVGFVQARPGPMM